MEHTKTRIPIDQAAYQEGRSTTEVFSINLLVEKSVTSSDHKVCIIRLDMTKAFETVYRNQLFETLQVLAVRHPP